MHQALFNPYFDAEEDFKDESDTDCEDLILNREVKEKMKKSEDKMEKSENIYKACRMQAGKVF